MAKRQQSDELDQDLQVEETVAQEMVSPELEEKLAQLAQLEAALQEKLRSVTELEYVLKNNVNSVHAHNPSRAEKSYADPSYVANSLAHGTETAKQFQQVKVLPLETGSYCYGPLIYDLKKGVRTEVCLPLAVELAGVKPKAVVQLIG